MKRVELEIERLSKSGDGVAQLNGRAVFVSGALPGERVVAELAEGGKALHAEVIEVLKASPARRTPPCALASTCGGCDWMHVDERTQLEQKQQIVVSALEHLGDLPPGRYELLPAVESPLKLGYRRRAVLHPVSGRLGFNGRKTHQRVVVDHCPALTDSLAGLPGTISDLLGNSLKDVESVHLFEAEGKLALSLHVEQAGKQKHRDAAQTLVREGIVDGVVVVPQAGKGGQEQFGKPVLEEDGVLHRPDGFAQANAEVNRLLVKQAVELLDPAGASLDLFSGNGNFTFPIARRAKSVVAIESSSVSVQLAQDAARRQQLGNVRFMQGDCEKLVDGLVREGSRFDRILLDPPRAGSPGIGKWAARLLAERVVYVACDPTSLARDAVELVANGYQPLALQVFDLFPQTKHIEAVMAFAR